MALYGKVENGVITKRRQKDNPESVLDGDGFPIWRPLISTPRPAYDSDTHHIPVRTQGLSVGDAVAVNGPSVTEAWAAPVALDAGELDGRKDSQTSVIADDPVLGKVLFRIANEALEGNGKSTLTPAQFRNFIKGLL